MRLLNDAAFHSFAQFKEECAVRRCVLFGIGPYVKNFLTSLEREGIEIDYIVDEEFLNWGRKIKGRAVSPPSRLRKENPADVTVLIGTDEIGRSKAQLEVWGITHVFAYYLFFEKMYDDEAIEGYTVQL
jgi:hypothetical protein